MVERWDPTEPLPPARPVPGGPPPLADGTDRYPAPLPSEYLPPRRGALVATIAVCAVIVLVLMVAGIAGLRP